MEDNRILDVVVNLLGLGILLWLLGQALMDLIRRTKRKSVFQNFIIVAICLIYSLKIVLKDLLGVVP
jgi:hypothetical protein